MTKKRRNNGKNRKNRGKVGFVRCDNCYRAVPKDKAVKRTQQRHMIPSAGAKDLREASVYKQEVPKFYNKINYCISCACHNHQVRVRSRTDRRVRLVRRQQFRRERRPEPKKENKEAPAAQAAPAAQPAPAAAAPAATPAAPASA